jgi:hypothetical protein
LLLLLVVAGAGESFLSAMLMADEEVDFCELALDGVLDTNSYNQFT